MSLEIAIQKNTEALVALHALIANGGGAIKPIYGRVSSDDPSPVGAAGTCTPGEAKPVESKTPDPVIETATPPVVTYKDAATKLLALSKAPGKGREAAVAALQEVDSNAKSLPDLAPKPEDGKAENYSAEQIEKLTKFIAIVDRKLAE